MKKMSIGAVFIAIFCLFEAGLVSGTERIDVNTAPLEDLVKIIHIGEARARELISLRPFASVDDLIRIKGIGESRIKDIKQQGLAWASETKETKIVETQVEMKEVEMKEVQPLSLAEAEPQLAAAGEQLPQIKQVSPTVLLTALALAVFSGAAILVLKKTTK